jgi:ABC-type lipoprotein release transport system permease subunit
MFGGIGTGQLLKRVLFTVEAADCGTFLLVMGILAVVALAACVIPARQALKVSPLDAIRCD